MARAEVAGNMRIDATDFKAVVRALRRSQPATYREIKKELREAGVLVAVAAKVIARDHSKTIPGTIRVRSVGASVEVRAGAPHEPLAALYELGNKGQPLAETFRHPVFGTDAWVEQKRYPFLGPAVALTEDAVDEAVGRALDHVTAILVLGV